MKKKYFAVIFYTANAPIIYGIGTTEKSSIQNVDAWIEDKNWRDNNEWETITLSEKAYRLIEEKGDLEGSNFSDLVELDGIYYHPNEINS